ncbi:unnamed protein product [Mytilus edulis]|uniref:SWIM-type domain-containing protein n=1 Tax=Mytilus edulis TaxID=6550 RepID=A0A8S3TYA7_MYTED|nr:unnamed protein product [Mytilus edulis]
MSTPSTEKPETEANTISKLQDELRELRGFREPSHRGRHIVLIVEGGGEEEDFPPFNNPQAVQRHFGKAQRADYLLSKFKVGGVGVLLVRGDGVLLVRGDGVLLALVDGVLLALVDGVLLEVGDEFFYLHLALYKEYNIQSLDNYRKYSNDVPEFLRRRPRKCVDHCLARIPPAATLIPIENMEVNHDMLVRSVESDSVYQVRLNDDLPKCSCPDWRKHHWSCKHMLAVMMNMPNKDWNTLPEYLKSNPSF